MELRQLRFFIRTAELGSISRAAMELRFAQPALSRQMRSLEEALGVQLFVRDGRGVALTEVGSIFYDEIAGILRQLDNVCVAVREHQNTPSGEIRVGVFPNFGASFTADLMLLCKERFPNVRLVLFEGFSYQIAGWIQSKQIDLGFVYDVETYRHLTAEFVFREVGFLVGPPQGWPFGATVPFSELSRGQIITPAPPSNTRRRIQAAAAETGTDVNFSFELDSLVAIKRMVMLNQGWSVFTYASVWEEVEACQLVAAEVISPAITFDLALVSAYGAMLPAPARQVIELFKEAVSRAAGQKKWVGEFIVPEG
jgi:LysR family nitrogen assimilation transcriptional regulator